MYINGHNLCIGCMRPLDSDGGCSFCGLKQEEYSPIPRCLTPGTVLAGQYVTGKVLGEGSFGITYMGWDKSLDIPVAIKEYFPSDMVSRDVICGSDNNVYLYESEKKGDYDNYLKKFLNEAKCLSRFNEVEGIVSVRDFFYENNTAYLVMQYIDGISVKEHIYKNGKMPAKEVVEAMKPVLHALEQVHSTGIIHRDISPDNLMIRKDGSLVLIDFGAARMRNIDNTKTMTVMFKRGFSPEEQYRYKGRWGAYTDVYSICATMYFMMTETAPMDSVIRALGDDMPSLVSMKGLDISVRQRKAIMKGLAVTAKNRWQSIGELCEAMYGEDDTIGEGTWWKKRERTAVGIFLALLVIGLSVGGVWIISGTKESQIDGKELPVTAAKVETQQISTSSSDTSEDKKIVLEDFSGMKRKTAENLLSQYPENLTVNWKEKYSGKVKKGYVISQSISEGTEISEGESLRLDIVVSKGEKKVAVPSLVGLKSSIAENKLKEKKLTCRVAEGDSEQEKGTVIRQSIKAGKKVAEGTKITITVSKGKTVPDTQQSEDSSEKKKPTGDEFAGVIQ